MVMNMFIHSPAEVTDVLQAKKERVNHQWANRIWQRVYSSRFLRFYGIWYDESGLSLERKRREKQDPLKHTTEPFPLAGGFTHVPICYLP